jgi:hypothetical protein
MKLVIPGRRVAAALQASTRNDLAYDSNFEIDELVAHKRIGEVIAKAAKKRFSKR